MKRSLIHLSMFGILFVMLIGLLFIVPITTATTNNSPTLQDDQNQASLDMQAPSSSVIPVQNLTQGVINTNETHLFYFVQISDIHLNMYADPERLTRFDDFCNQINSTIKPAFVISSGDNVDANETSVFDFYNQNPAEYQFFNTTLTKYGFNSTFWYPLIGNHEMCDIGQNYSLYTEYIRNTTQYAVDFNPGFGIYRFIMLNTNHEYGLNSFFELYGDMKQDKLDQFEQMINIPSIAPLNQTFLVGHHPTDEIISEKSSSGKNFEDLIVESNATAYLNGHIHYPDLYINHGSYDELECPSFKDRYMYRIDAIDNDVFSFNDVVEGQYPQILITNPTDSQFYDPKMPLTNMNDGQIRVLLFDNTTVNSAVAYIDGVYIGNLTNQGNNLWTINYSKTAYATGTHALEIIASAANGQVEDTIHFELSSFTPAPIINWNPIYWYYAFPYYQTVIAILSILIAFCIIAFILGYKAKISPVILVLLAILVIYPFFGPLFIGILGAGQIGMVMLTRIWIGDTYCFSLLSYILAIIYFLSGIFLAYSIYRSVIMKTKNPVKHGGGFLLALYIDLIGTLMCINALYDGGIVALLLSPTTYLYVAIPLIIYFYRKHSNKSS